MLERLSIQNVALIPRAELEFSRGLNVLTGETGAGKSVILDCIDFALGAKSDKSMIRYGAAECSVRAEFSAYGEEVRALLDEFEIEAEELLVISRKLTADGKSTVRVNGCGVTLAMLRRLTALLVDVHGQSEHFFLLKESNQLRLLDSVAGEPVAAAKAALSEALGRRRAVLADMRMLGGDEGERSRRLDILRYQIDELTRAELKSGEEEELLSLRARFRNAEKIMQGLNGVRDFLRADGGGIDGVNGAKRSVGGLSTLSEAYASLDERLENAAAELEDIADEAERCLDELNLDEREEERVEERLEEIRTLKKKYGGSVEAALEFLAAAEREQEMLSESGERYARLTEELAGLEDEIYAKCVALTDARKCAAESFTARVTAELMTLNISSARFEVFFGDYGREDVGKATAEGLGEVKFLFSANAGEPLKEMGSIISGGEMSRFMLAVKSQLSGIGGIGTYIFDEIDAGIGGKTAHVVAEKFCKIAKDVQVIAVTHLAQIAALADKQFYIEKKEADGRTLTELHPLDEEGRRREIARLIDGSESEIALAHAEKLLKDAAIYKNSL